MIIRRLSFSSLLTLFAIAVGEAAPPMQAQPAEQPNIVILMADDLGYGELGCQGNTQIPTPHIDSLAGDGVRFTSAYVTAPNCSPSRAGLLTGKFPTRFGYEFNPIGAKNELLEDGLPAETTTIAEWLQGQGYTTGIVGKWHLGGAAVYHPQRHGFDEFFGFTHEGHYFAPTPWKGTTTMLRRLSLPGNAQGRWTSQDGKLIYSTHMGHAEPDYDANNPLVRSSQPVNETAYLTDAFTREAVDFIDRHQDKPFLLYVAYNAVHSPLQAQDAYMEKYAHIEDVHRRIFAGMLANLDDSVGAVLDKLDQADLRRRTLVFFLSDNGGPTRELTSSNAPLRGGKGDIYEGGIRVPMLLRWPGVVSPATQHDGEVSSMDIFATVVAANGQPSPANIDGVDLLRQLQNSAVQSEPRSLYWRQGTRAGLRRGTWKLVRHGRRNTPGDWELYDLSLDMAETKNLAEQYPQRLDEMLQHWQTLDQEMQPARFR